MGPLMGKLIGIIADMLEDSCETLTAAGAADLKLWPTEFG